MCLACKRGHLIKCYSEGDLYKQLRYFQFMFEIPKFEQTCKIISFNFAYFCIPLSFESIKNILFRSDSAGQAYGSPVP